MLNSVASPIHADAKWIWASTETDTNQYVAFRRRVTVQGQLKSATLHLTADTRYELRVNDRWLGHGPVRSWPSPWPVDAYDLSGELKPGSNLLAILVTHFGTSTFQHIHLAHSAGLIAQLTWTDDLGTHTLVSDHDWLAKPHLGYASIVPRISCQQAWEEQFDARVSLVDSSASLAAPPDWSSAQLDDAHWPHARIVRNLGQPPHETLELRDIPMLTREIVEPVRVRDLHAVRTADYTFHLCFGHYLNQVDRTANIFHYRVLLLTHVFSHQPQFIHLQDIMQNWGGNQWTLNGQPITFDDRTFVHDELPATRVKLNAGWNTLMVRSGEYSHCPAFTVNVWTQHPVKWSAHHGLAKPAHMDPQRSMAGHAHPAHAHTLPNTWLVMGPFALDTPNDQRPPTGAGDTWKTQIFAQPLDPTATAQRWQQITTRGLPDDADYRASFTQPLPASFQPPVDVMGLCLSEKIIPNLTLHIDDPSALQRDNASWTTIHPCDQGDVRLLLDFGDEVMGYHEFEIDAPAHTILDFHNFEFIQRDGHLNLAQGMNNSFRYICKSGIQHYRTFIKRGFRYTYLTLRRFNRPLRIRYVRLINSTYPQARRGDFACSDALLSKLWHVGARSVHICSDDTYVDCPSYEQTLWVGDARNESMVDLIANGDPRLSARCWRITAKSLDRSPIAESQVPSGWQNILPAWTALWMRWAHEHFQATGDQTFAHDALAQLDRNFQGIAQHTDARGLFNMTAWQLFDWAPMDIPPQAIVTHVTCQFVQALRQTAELADHFKQKDRAKRWRAWADRAAAAVNKYLWSDTRQAYADCEHPDGSLSIIFSQQTATAAYISGVATGKRAQRCRQIIEKPPKGFVTAGSPFFMFFALEGMVREARYDTMIDTLRSYWGPQIHAGATTIWECYYHDQPRKTRSHCHGWSAAPTYFLSAYVLGIRPLAPGYQKLLIAPQTGDLTWAHGTVPTPQGNVEIHWHRTPMQLMCDIHKPAKIPARIELPARGKLTVTKGKVKKIATRAGATVLQSSDAHIQLGIE